MSSSGAAAVLSLSNLAFFLPFVEALRKRRFTRAPIFLALVGISGIYHACYSSWMLCILSRAQHQNLDFFLSYLLIPLSALYFIDFPIRYAYIERWLIMAFAFSIYVARVQVDFAYHATVEYTLAGVSAGILLIYLVGNGGFPAYHWRYVGLGLGCVAISLIFFIWPETLGYTASHSIWHVFAALGQYFLLKIKVAAPVYANLDAQLVYTRPRIQ